MQRLTALSPGRWLGAATLDWAVIVGVFFLVRVLDHPVAYAIAVFPLGSRQQGLGALFHDAAHRMVSRRRWVNELFGCLFAAWPLGLTLAGYRRYHLVHHRALGTDRDPENGHKRLLRHWNLPLRRASFLHFVSDLVGGGVPHLVAAGKMTRPPRLLETLGFLGYWALFGLLFWKLGALWIPILWVVSIATVFWSGVRLRIWTEHLGTRDTHRISMHPVFEALVMPHAIGLHWEHHHFPNVPFHRLRELRQVIIEPAPIPLSRLMSRFRAAPPLPSGELPPPQVEP